MNYPENYGDIESVGSNGLLRPCCFGLTPVINETTAYVYIECPECRRIVGASTTELTSAILEWNIITRIMNERLEENRRWLRSKGLLPGAAS